MLKHSLKDNSIHVSIENMDFSYRIPLKKIGNRIDWRIGEKGTTGIVIKDVSTWALQLFTKKVTDEKYIKQFKSIVQEHASNNAINWDDTLLAVAAQNEYSKLVASNNSAQEKMTDNDILSILEKKYDIA
ncbi:MAG: hypothetical protein COA38_05150 [Fluviicola sp.]|nr:MAG: hypothetical protein COA38_05150 [Fluviicola sp.]